MKLPNKLLIIGFTLTAIAQLAVPSKMIYDSEKTADYGTEYKFRTRPIDPTDPFRGKYITLSFDDTKVTVKDTTWKHRDEGYVYIKADKDGFARVTNLSHKPLDIPDDYFKAKVWAYNGTIEIEFPFDRYYMEEGKAYEAEMAYREYNSDNTDAKPAYAVVAVRDGHTVLKDVIIDGMPVREYVLENREKK